MRYSWLAAGLVLLGSASAAQAQLYFFGGGNGAYTYYYGPGYGYGYLPNAMPAGRPYMGGGGVGGSPQFTWYNPHTGYFSNQQTGLPWNYRSGVGPISRTGSTGGGPGGVVRYSRTPTETNDPYLMARSGRIDVPSPDEAAKALQAVKAAEKVADKPTTAASATTKPTVPKRTVRKAPVYSRPTNVSSGSADWVPAFSR